MPLPIFLNKYSIIINILVQHYYWGDMHWNNAILGLKVNQEKE